MTDEPQPSLNVRVSKLVTDAVWVARVGSTAWNAARTDSDIDAVAVVVETPSQCMGLESPFTVEHRRTANEGEPSGPDDLDVTVYGLRHFGRLVAKCNPNVLTALFVEPDAMRVDLTGLREHVRCQRLALTHAGMIRGVMPAVKEAYWDGYPDTLEHDLVDKAVKLAVHASCAAIQGLGILTDGTVEIPPSGHLGLWLRSLRNGEISQTDWLAWIEHALGLLEPAWDHLPPEPDAEAIDDYLVAAHRAWWDGNKPGHSDNWTATMHPGWDPS